jgi:thymidylate synthase
MKIYNANEAWLIMLRDVMAQGYTVSPRGMKINEVRGYQSLVSMSRPVVTLPQRALSRRFLTGEAVWILEGDNRVETISPYNKNIAKFSDDGVFFAGAYGPMVADQLMYVVDSLVKDRDSRQAVLTIWRPNPRPSKDFPCTVAIQFMIRERLDDEGKNHVVLHCLDTMRSSDAWLGWPYDIFNFSMLSAMVALMYRNRTESRELELGEILLTAGSQHVYETNYEQVFSCLTPEAVKAVEEAPTPTLNLDEFGDHRDLITHLKQIRDYNKVRGDEPPARSFLKELL